MQILLVEDDSIFICIVAVLLLTFITMWFAGRRQRQESIVGVLQSEVT